MKAGEPDQVSSGKQGQLPLDQHLQATQHPSVHTFTNETHTQPPFVLLKLHRLTNVFVLIHVICEENIPFSSLLGDKSGSCRNDTSIVKKAARGISHNGAIDLTMINRGTGRGDRVTLP